MMSTSQQQEEGKNIRQRPGLSGRSPHPRVQLRFLCPMDWLSTTLSGLAIMLLGSCDSPVPASVPTCCWCCAADAAYVLVVCTATARQQAGTRPTPSTSSSSGWAFAAGTTTGKWFSFIATACPFNLRPTFLLLISADPQQGRGPHQGWDAQGYRGERRLHPLPEPGRAPAALLPDGDPTRPGAQEAHRPAGEPNAKPAR